MFVIRGIWHYISHRCYKRMLPLASGLHVLIGFLTGFCRGFLEGFIFGRNEV